MDYYKPENIPAGTIYMWGFGDKNWREVTPKQAWDEMYYYMKGSTYSEFDRMVRTGLRGDIIKLLNGSARFQFVPK